MTQYALMPTQRSENMPDRKPSDQEVLGYFILVEPRGSGMEHDEGHAPVVIALLRAAPCDAESMRACSHAEPGWHSAPAEPLDADLTHLCG